MFDKSYVERLRSWSNFRDSLSTSKKSIEDVIKLYNCAPICTRAADPYNKDTWPDPWQLIKENNYCEFTKILAIYYTLKLSEHFSQCRFEIHIVSVSYTHLTLTTNREV